MNEPYVLSVVIPLYLAGALLFRYFSITKSKYPHAKTSTLKKKEKKKKKQIGTASFSLFSVSLGTSEL